MATAKTKEKSTRVVISIRPTMLEFYQGVAAGRSISFSELVRRSLDAYVEANDDGWGNGHR